MIIIPVEVFDVSRSKVSESLTVSILRIPLGTGCTKSDCTGKIAVFIKFKGQHTAYIFRPGRAQPYSSYPGSKEEDELS